MEDHLRWSRAGFEELEQGVRDGNPEAMYWLSSKYRTGDGVELSMSKAVDLLMRAVELGHAASHSSMGVRYYYGQEVPKNHRLAMKWYLSAAALGDLEGMYNVGDLFDDSDQIPKNPAEACAWMMVAAAGGYVKALQRVDPLVKVMSPGTVDATVARAIQILRHTRSGLSLDPSRSFAEAKSGAPAVYEEGMAPTRLSLLVEFNHRSEYTSTDRLLMYELVEGTAPLYVRGTRRAGKGPGGMPPEIEHEVMRLRCVDRKQDSRGAMLVFTDVQKLADHYGEGASLVAPAKDMVAMMQQLDARTLVVNAGTPSCYSMTRRDPEQEDVPDDEV